MHHQQESSLLTEVIVNPRACITLHAFKAQEAGELSFDAGDLLEVWIEDASAGWSLGAIKVDEETWERGLIPRGYYKVSSGHVKRG